MARDELTTKLRTVSGGSARSGVRRRPDTEPPDSEDAPIAGQSSNEDSRQILMDGLAGVERGSPAEKALFFALDRAMSRGQPPPPIGFTPNSLKRWAVAIVFTMGIVMPIVSEFAGAVRDFFQPADAVIERLDATNDRLDQIEASILDANEVVTALVTWSIDCERARQSGGACSKVPAVLNLVAAQAEAAKDP